VAGSFQYYWLGIPHQSGVLEEAAVGRPGSEEGNSFVMPVREQNAIRDDIFISHSSQDSGIATEIVRALRAKGLRVFLAERDLAKLWGKDLEGAMRDVFPSKATAAMILLSSSYAGSRWCRFELASLMARVREIPESARLLLPVRLDESPVPAELASIAYLELKGKTPSELASLARDRLDEFYVGCNDSIAGLTDEALIERISRWRDVKAFEVLYERLYPALIGTILQLPDRLDRATGEDVAAKTLMRLWEDAERFDPASENVRSWLNRIAELSIVEQFRKNARSGEMPSAEVDDVELPRVDDHWEAHHSKDARRSQDVARALSKAVGMMSPAERKIILLRSEGRSFSDIAELMLVSVNAVRISYHHGIVQLRRTLTASPQDHETTCG